MNKYTEVSKADWIRTAIYLLLYVVAIVVGAILLLPANWPVGFLIWLFFIAGGGLIMLVTWHARNFAYQCPLCQHEFEISVFRDFISPQWIRKKYLNCPSCRKRTWALVIKKAK